MDISDKIRKSESGSAQNKFFFGQHHYTSTTETGLNTKLKSKNIFL